MNFIATVKPSRRAYRYNDAGQQIRIADLALGKAVDYSYDALDRRIGETLSQGGLVQRSQTNIYNNQGWLAGVSADARFDAGGGASLSQQLAVSYQFDASGNRVQVSNAPAGGAAAEIGTYSYDASGRMLSGRDDKRNEVVNSLSYDGFGNRISESRTGETAPTTTPFTSYSYDANNRVLSSSAGEAWAYDANGNTTSQTSRDGSTSSTAFNAENRSTSSSGGGTTSSSTYDAAGNVTSSRVDGDGFGFTEVTQRDVRYLEVRKDITNSWAKGAARLEGATSFSYDANGNLAFLDRGRNQKTGQNSVAYFDYDLEGQIIGRADKASALTNAAFFAGYAADPDGVAASGDGESGFSFFNPSQTQQVQRQLFGSQFTSSASTGLQNYLYANNKPISQAAGNQSLALKKLTLQGGQPIQTPPDPITGEQAASTGSRLLIQEGDIKRTAGVIDRTITARNIAARAYDGPPGFAQLSTAAQDRVIAYVQAQLPPDAEIVAGAQVTLHSFILMVDASYTGLSQITDYSLRQLGSDGIPGGTVQSHVVRAGDTLQTIAQIYFGSPAYWYLIADANGLSGSERLAEGVTLTIPNKVANSANSAQTFKVYNESEIIGSTSPEIRTVAKKKKWYQKLIQILIIVIMIVAVVMTAGAALAAAGPAGAALLGSLGAVGAAGAAVAGSVAAALGTSLAAAGILGGLAIAGISGALIYGAANVLTQGLSIAAKMQDSFQWKQVAKAAGKGAVSGVAAYAAVGVADWAKGAELGAWGQAGARVGIEAATQVAQDGKITNMAGLAMAALPVASSNAFVQGVIANKKAVGVGLQLLQTRYRGGDNAMSWVSIAGQALGASMGTYKGVDVGRAFTAIGQTAVAYDRYGAEGAWDVALQQVGSYAGEAVTGGASLRRTLEPVVEQIGVPNEMKSRQSLYGLSSGSQQGLRLGGGSGLRLSGGAVQAWSDGVDGGIALNGSMAPANEPPAWEQRSTVDQVLEAFSNPTPVDRSGDVLLAAGPGYDGMGGMSQGEEKQRVHAQKMAMISDVMYLLDPSDASKGNRGTLPEGVKPAVLGEGRLEGFTQENFESTSGFAARLFYDERSDSYTLGFRGTDALADFSKGNLQAIDPSAPQYKEAIALTTRLQVALGDRLTDLTGHSLGGGLSAASSMMTGIPATTFNAAGLNSETVVRAGGSWSDERAQATITNYRVKDELLTSLQERGSIGALPIAIFTPFIGPTALALNVIAAALPDAAGRQITIDAINLQGANMSFLERNNLFQNAPLNLHGMDYVLRGMSAYSAGKP